MPFGKLPVSNNSIPQHDPPYSNNIPTFSDVTVLTVKYRTSFSSIGRLIPEVLEVEEEPLVTATLLDYGKSPAGPFKEFIHTVEVKYLGRTYDFCLSLILDNEYGVLAGREPTGFPKRLGRLSLTPGSSNEATGYVERPAGQKLVEFEFEAKASQTPAQRLDMAFLNLRVIPSPVAGAPASLKDLVPTNFEIKPAEVWEGLGKLGFPEQCPRVEPVNKIEILRYESSTLAYGSVCVLQPSEEVFTL
ncbi:Decarboxylase DEC1 [Colletotrichum tanaceti]|uniref:Decarboxylase DEC1 n=1 Tax=Colletotrichum tanaceti TaxID=1306861 RepID=A0A4U6XNV5_9PEZI|nr:Decarboxylase DEC1 [Colletotrichum tanaceti]TKW57428.1 Decarboxylase DEC1 [Colletotrichum tanaceti]